MADRFVHLVYLQDGVQGQNMFNIYERGQNGTYRFLGGSRKPEQTSECAEGKARLVLSLLELMDFNKEILKRP